MVSFRDQNSKRDHWAIKSAIRKSTLLLQASEKSVSLHLLTPAGCSHALTW